jgi:ribosomal-protein-alanine N-acetyltransferase
MGKESALEQISPHARTPSLSPRYNDDVPFTIRDLQPADFETLWAIDQQCFPPGISYSRRELKFYMRRPGSFTLIAVNGAPESPASVNEAKSSDHSGSASSAGESVAGFIVAEADRGSGHIITIDVIAATRRSGAGSQLLQSAEDRLRASSCHTVELETAVDNVPALAFYKRHGYSVVRTFPRYYSNGVDALVLEKNLTKSLEPVP